MGVSLWPVQARPIPHLVKDPVSEPTRCPPRASAYPVSFGLTAERAVGVLLSCRGERGKMLQGSLDTQLLLFDSQIFKTSF